MTSKTSDFARYERSTESKAPLISRKDTIIIAMLVNIALLVVLFATASRHHETIEPVLRQPEFFRESIIAEPVVQKPSKATVHDEIDEILSKIGEKNSAKKPVAESKSALKSAVQPEYYIVKSGDSPWKIARKFHLDFEDLLKMNGLNEEKAKNLKIGQKLRIR